LTAKCWFCNSEENLRVHERAYDGAPYLNDDGSLQMVCQECHEDMQRYRLQVHNEMSLKRAAMFGALGVMTDAEYAAWAEHESRREDARDG